MPTTESLLIDLAAAAGIDLADLDMTQKFVDLGLHPHILQGLIDQWRSAGIDIHFADLSGCPTVGQAVALISGAAFSATRRA